MIDSPAAHLDPLTGALLRAIVESSDDAIISKDLNGIITSWNKGAERIFGYTAEEAIGQAVLMLIPPERQHEEPEILARLRRGERIDHYETVRRRKDGGDIHVSLTVSPIRDAEGKVVGASKVARDITERRRIEKERAEHANRVEAALAQRTLELTAAHEVRRRSEAMAVLGALAAGIAHDLSNLLLPMRTRIQLLQESRDLSDEELREQLAAMSKNIEYIGELGQRVRHYMRDASRETMLNAGANAVTESIALHSWCKQVEPFLESIVPANDRDSRINVECRIGSDVPALTVNRTALTQAVYNLVQNSVKAMRGSRIGSTITVRGWRDEQGSTCLSVDDDGPGMTPEVLARSLEPRFTTESKTGGTGMGLSLVKAFVDHAGGELRVFSPTSRNGSSAHGTSVVMRFDVSPKQDAHADLQHVRSEPATQPASS